MFPSCGYFKGINCPFFASGLCDRPYCHFRHSKVEEKTKDNGPSYSTSVNVTGKGYSTCPSSGYNKPQLSFGVSEVASYSTAQSYHTTGPVEAYSTSEADSAETNTQSTCAIPTFTGQTKNLPASSEESETYQSLPRISGLPKSRLSSSTNGNLPLYKPTPKTRVQVTVRADTPAYNPTPKNELGEPSKRSKSLEYDPVKNFAFQVQEQGGDDEQRNSNGTHAHEEALFSDSDAVSDGGEWEAEVAEINESEKDNAVVAETNITNDDSIASKQLPSYADLLTPSSYFTSKLPSFSSKKSEDRKKNSKMESSRKPTLHHSHDVQVEKHHASSTSSSSSTSKHQVSRSSSTSSTSTKHSKKHSSTSSRVSKGSSSEKSSSSRRHSSQSSDRHEKSRSSSSELKDKHNHHNHSSDRKGDRLSEGERASSSTSEKENKKKSSDPSQSVALKRRSTSTDSSPSSSKHHKSSEGKNHHSLSSTRASSSKHHKSGESSTKSSSVSKYHKLSTSGLHKSSEKHDSSTTKLSQPLNHKLSVENHEKSNKSSENEKKTDSISLSKLKTEGSSSHSSFEGKGLISSEHKLCCNSEATSCCNKHRGKKSTKIELDTVKLEKERRNSVENTAKTLSVSERRISDLTCNLFGEDSADSDSDVQIVEPPPAKPVEVLELTDSEEESGGFTDDVDLLSDPNTFDECLKIFQESERKLSKQQKQAKDEQKKNVEIRKSVKKEEDPPSIGRKRMAHKGADQVKRPLKVSGQQRLRLSPAEVMHNRIVEMQKRALLRAARREGRESELPKEVMSNSTCPQPSESSGSSSDSLSAAASSLLSQQRKREAHTPKKSVKTSPETQSAVWSPNSFYKKKAPTVEKKQITPAVTASKTEKRKAHTPTQMNMQRPVLPAAFGAKVPTNIRQRYLNLIIDEYLKFSPEQVSVDKGLEEEEAVYDRASNKNIYLRLVVNAIKKIRTEAAEHLPSSSKKPCIDTVKSPGHMTQSHAATLGGSRAAKTSFTLNRSSGSVRGPGVNITGAELYRRLTKFVLKEEELQEHGFPRPSEDGTSKAVFYKKESMDTLLKDNERVCRRCGKRFYVAKDGKPLLIEDCCYHYGNAYKKKVAGSIDSRYACCNDRAGSKGCTVAKSHVHERNKTENLSGYMKTMSSTSSEKNQKVLSLDCEMVYTFAGLELARVTVVGENCETEYEALVKPDTPVIDYNTRFSGITEADLEGVTTTLRGVQAVLLDMISDKTILIGHSLESDLTALKLLHGTVVDTSVVFPHRLGLPYKRALRNLMVEHLQKIIQADDGGHDSKEDAVACMELMIHKVKEEAKHEQRRN